MPRHFIFIMNPAFLFGQWSNPYTGHSHLARTAFARGTELGGEGGRWMEATAVAGGGASTVVEVACEAAVELLPP